MIALDPKLKMRNKPKKRERGGEGPEAVMKRRRSVVLTTSLKSPIERRISASPVSKTQINSEYSKMTKNTKCKLNNEQMIDKRERESIEGGHKDGQKGI